MKKQLVSMMALCLTAACLVGCGSSNGNSSNHGDSAALKDMKVEEFVTLGEYKGLQVTVPAPAVDEEELSYWMNSVYQGHVTEKSGIKDRPVAEGDTVNLDYEGKKDGVAFNGGTAQGYNLTIGSGAFIDGFEDGLIGVNPGETVDLNLTFPENYKSTDLAGQAVVFTVTVNYILPSEMDDAIIAEMGLTGVTNQEEFRQYVYDYLYAAEEQNYDASVQNAVLNAFMAGNTFQQVPEELVTKYEEAARSNIESTAATYGTDVDTFTNVYYGMDFEDFVITYSAEAAKQDLALQAVANEENLNISDEELDSMLLENAQASGYTTIEEFIGETSKEDYREYFLFDKVINYLIENAVVAE